MRIPFFCSLILLVSLFSSCKSSKKGTEDNPLERGDFNLPNSSDRSERDITSSKENELVGVYFMPSWNTSPDPEKDRDSFWSCLTGKDNCSNLQNPAIWGPKGRIYNKKYPYEGALSR